MSKADLTAGCTWQDVGELVARIAREDGLQVSIEMPLMAWREKRTPVFYAELYQVIEGRTKVLVSFPYYTLKTQQHLTPEMAFWAITSAHNTYENDPWQLTPTTRNRLKVAA